VVPFICMHVEIKIFKGLEKSELEENLGLTIVVLREICARLYGKKFKESRERFTANCKQHPRRQYNNPDPF
jgi:predicted site-specific integrase-resolvase